MAWKEGGTMRKQINLVPIITDERKRLRLQFIGVFLFLAIVAAFMSALNLITHKGSLTVVTAAFSALCFVNLAIVVLSRNKERGMSIASTLFMLELIPMFTFFIVSGNPDGFSCIWAAMLPTCGMLVFGRKRTTIVCAVVFVILVFFFWTLPGQSLLRFSYSQTFMTRFPILYIAFFSLAFLLETIRAATQRDLDRLRESYKRLSTHDYLTKMLNRQGLEELEKNAAVGAEQAVFMLDIDYFKNINDRYGHDVGDLVLVSVSQAAEQQAHSKICRWGGEEFVIWFPDSRNMVDPEEIRTAVEKMVVHIPNCDKTTQVTVSIGAVKGNAALKELISRADAALYQAKENGRNRVVWG